MYFSAEEKTSEMKIVFLEEEVKELKHALRETRNRNQYLSQLLEQAEEQRKKQWVSCDQHFQAFVVSTVIFYHQ